MAAEVIRKRYGRYGFELSHPRKVLFPGAGLTKGDLLDYYERIAEVMVPHLRDRPLTQQRFPDGIGAIPAILGGRWRESR